MGISSDLRDLVRLSNALDGLGNSGRSPAFLDHIARLAEVLERMRRVLIGEVRIVVLGANASMKSTTLRLLLSRTDVARVAPGAVSAVATELRLIPDDTPGTSMSVEVMTLTEEGARRRAQRILDLPPDDGRALADLAELEGPSAPLVQDMHRASLKWPYGQRMPLSAFEAAGGSITFDRGWGYTFIARAIAEVPVSRAWDLAWAKGRPVVVVDTPGTRKNGRLEDVVIEEMQGGAHIALLTAACGSGTSISTPEISGEPHCVFVATRLDNVDNPQSANSIQTLEAAIAGVTRELSMAGRPGRRVRIAGISGAWAASDRDAWMRFDPENPGVWETAEAARARWRDAAWDPYGPTEGSLREAIEAAVDDGGVRRLRTLIEELAAVRAGLPDTRELASLAEQALDLTRAAAEELLTTVRRTPRSDEVRDDPRPIAALRRIAREGADSAVYGEDAWAQARLVVEQRRGGLDQAIGAVDPLLRIDFAQLAADTTRTVEEHLLEDLSEWWYAHVADEFPGLIPAAADGMLNSPGPADQGGAAAVTAEDRPGDDPAGGPQPGGRSREQAWAADQYGTMARDLVRQLAGTGRRGGSPGMGADGSGAAAGAGRLAGVPQPFRPIYFRQVARVREELSRLLERRLIDMFEPGVADVQRQLSDILAQQRLALATDAGPVGVLNQVAAQLTALREGWSRRV